MCALLSAALAAAWRYVLNVLLHTIVTWKIPLAA